MSEKNVKTLKKFIFAEKLEPYIILFKNMVRVKITFFKKVLVLSLFVGFSLKILSGHKAF